MMFIRSLADFNGSPWAVQVTVGAITVTAQATSSPDRHDKQGSGDFYLAISADLQLAISADVQLATSGDFDMATDNDPIRQPGPAGGPSSARVAGRFPRIWSKQCSWESLLS